MEHIISYLKETYRPLAMILYGSYADGSNQRNSDFDALLVVAEGNLYHDTAAVMGTVLDVFVYPVSSLGEDCDYEEFIQILDGDVIFDTDGIGQNLKDRVAAFVSSQPAKSDQEIQDSLQWCRKMLSRIHRGDAEGLYRCHWLLVDSLEIACDVLGYPYRGPKKCLAWMQEVHPSLFSYYYRALKEMTPEAIESWIACLEAQI